MGRNKAEMKERKKTTGHLLYIFCWCPVIFLRSFISALFLSFFQVCRSLSQTKLWRNLFPAMYVQYRTKVLGHLWSLEWVFDTCKKWLCISHIFTLSRLWYISSSNSSRGFINLSWRGREEDNLLWSCINKGRACHGLSSTEPVSIASLLIVYTAQ